MTNAENQIAEKPRRKVWPALVVLTIIVVAAGLWWRAKNKPDAAGAQGGPRGDASAERVITVVAHTVTAEDVPIVIEGLGNALALQTVNLKSQVDGRLEKVYFKEGQHVKKGDLLAQIDPRSFAIQLKQGDAALARDSALLKNNRLNLERYSQLREQNLASQQQLDDQKALVAQNEASILLDRAQMDAARLMLDYTRIVSPIDGITGVRQVDPGNIVHPNDQTGIVTITQIDPIAVVFSLPQDELTRIVEQQKKTPLEVEVFTRDGLNNVGKGELTVIDNQINAATATLRLKATIPNPDQKLWPNQFVKARVRLSVKSGAKWVPAAVIQRGTKGSFVYVIGADQRATPREVQIEMTLGDRAIIASGLEVGEKVVVEGQHLLRPGAKISIQPPHSGRGFQHSPSATPAASGAPSSSSARP